MCRYPFLRHFVCIAFILFAPLALAAKTLLVLGDSLSAGYGIASDAAWPVLLEKRLQENRLDYKVINASISGETTSGGLSRLDELLAQHSPQLLILALGANDGLRGTPMATIHANLVALVERAQANKSLVLLVGQRLPPNYGAYATQFQALFSEVAKRKKTAYADFLSDELALNRKLFQADNLHPTAEAQAPLLDNVWRGLRPLLK